MNKQKLKQNQRDRRRGRIRARIYGTAKRPRLSVYRSNKGMYLQLVNDERGKTIVSVSNNEIKKNEDVSADPKQGKKIAVSFELGKLIAKKALAKKIKQAVFDRGGYRYHGRVKAAADGARAGGLKF